MYKVLKDSENELIQRLQEYPLYSQDNKGNKAKIVARLLLPRTLWEWYILEGSYIEDAGTWQLYGITFSDNTPQGEYGYILLSELSAIVLKVPVEDAATGEQIGVIPQQVIWDTAAPEMTIDGLNAYRRSHTRGQ